MLIGKEKRLLFLKPNNELISRSKLERVYPTSDDIQIMKQIIHTIKSIRPEKRPRDLEKALSKVLKSNAQEREILIQILGYCGILQPKGFEGFFKSYVNYNERKR